MRSCSLLFFGLLGCGSPSAETKQSPGLMDEEPQPEPVSSCPDKSGAELTIDGERVAITNTLAEDTAIFGNAIHIQLVSIGADGSQRQVFVTLDRLVRGRSTKLSSSTSILYREYAADSTGQPPTFTDTYRDSSLAGSLDVARVASRPDEVSCGTFALTTTTSRAIVVTGRFRVKLVQSPPGQRAE